MATDWAADVKKYDAKADDAAIAGIVSYCGIALRNRDSALVSFSDKAETDRVRTNYLKKKLGLTQPDAVLDAAIAKVGDQMKADRTKNRVTVYYLLASEFKALGKFVKAAPAAKKAPATKAAAPTKTPAKPAATKSTTAAKVVGTATLAAGAVAAAKTKPAKAAPAKKAPVAKAAPAPAKKVAAAAPVKKAPVKKAAAAPKATTAKAAAPATNATQGMLDKAASTASDAAKAAPAAVAAAAAGTAAAVGAAATKTADTASAVADKASAMMAGGAKPVTASPIADDGSEMNWLWWVIGLAVLAFVAWWYVSSRNPDIEENNVTEAAASAAASDVGTDLAAAAPEGSVPIPAGAGVTSEMRDGKPVVKVYFDTGATIVTPAFAATAGGLKNWLDTHSGATLAVSGYSDPSGNVKNNAELAKQRAQAVQSALVAAGIPATSAKLEKPAEAIDASAAKEAARRVEVVVK